VHGELVRLGVCCGRKRVARLMRESGLVGVHARRRWRRAQPGDICAPDLVQRNFDPAGPDQLWAADVTQFRTGEGWLYLAAVIDLWSRRVIGWSTGNSATTELVSKALVMAATRRAPHRRAVHHSDRERPIRRWRSRRESQNSSCISHSERPGTATTTPQQRPSSPP